MSPAPVASYLTTHMNPCYSLADPISLLARPSTTRLSLRSMTHQDKLSTPHDPPISPLQPNVKAYHHPIDSLDLHHMIRDLVDVPRRMLMRFGH
jgi:hypothetical protein